MKLLLSRTKFSQNENFTKSHIITLIKKEHLRKRDEERKDDTSLYYKTELLIILQEGLSMKVITAPKEWGKDITYGLK